MAEWTEVRRGTFLARAASVTGCNLSILGGKGAWFWLVSRRDDAGTLVKGTEHGLAVAKMVVEDAARRLAGNSGGDVTLAKWKQVALDTVQAHVTDIEGFALTIIGRNGEWWWLVHRGECALAEGQERTLLGAKIAAEDAARGLVDNPEPGDV